MPAPHLRLQSFTPGTFCLHMDNPRLACWRMGLADGGGHPAVLVKAADTSDTVDRVTASTGSQFPRGSDSGGGGGWVSLPGQDCRKPQVELPRPLVSPATLL